MQETSSYNLTVYINPLRIALVLGSIVIGVAAAHALVHLVSYLFGISSGQMLGLKRFFDMGTEANLPTYVSALNLLLAGGLLALIARYESRRQRKQNWHWWGLAIGFVLMSFDEAAMIHELVGATLTRYFGRGQGIMYYTWYKLYIPIVLLIGLLYVPFLLRLPLRYSLRLLLAGVVFLSGAIGFEILESYLASHGLRGISVSRLFEETGEMLGVVLAIHALLLYLADNDVDLLLGFRQQSKSYDARLLRAENEGRSTS
jgi:hypothetical protein